VGGVGGGGRDHKVIRAAEVQENGGGQLQWPSPPRTRRPEDSEETRMYRCKARELRANEPDHQRGKNKKKTTYTNKQNSKQQQTIP